MISKKKWNPVKPLMEARLRPITFQVAMFIWYRIGKNGSTYVSVDRMSRDTTLSTNSVRKALRELKNKGIIEVRSRSGKTNITSFKTSFIGCTPTTVCTPTPTTELGGTPTTVCTQSNIENQVNKKPSQEIPAPEVAGAFLPSITIGKPSNSMNREISSMDSKEFLSKYGIKNGKVTKFNTGEKVKPASILSDIWRNTCPDIFPTMKFIPTFTIKQLGYFSLFYKRVSPIDPAKVLTHALTNWKAVGNTIKIIHTLEYYPPEPTIPFILKYCGEIANHYLESTKKVKSIPTPTPPPPEPVNQVLPPDEPETEYMTADKLKDSKFMKKGK